ncbi:hypothetical protein CL616_04385 [archaeon]|nr:hypothetical protein [archaeon]
MINTDQSKPKIAQDLSLRENESELIKFFKELAPYNFEEPERQGIGARLNLTGRTFRRLDLQETDLITLRLNGATFINCNFNGAQLRATHLRDTKFKRCSLVGTQLNKTFFRETKFINCDLTNANVDETQFFNVEITRSNFRDINNLTQKQFDAVTKGTKTVRNLPQHIKLKSKEKSKPKKSKPIKTQSGFEKLFGISWPPWQHT